MLDITSCALFGVILCWVMSLYLSASLSHLRLHHPFHPPRHKYVSAMRNVRITATTAHQQRENPFLECDNARTNVRKLKHNYRHTHERYEHTYQTLMRYIRRRPRRNSYRKLHSSPRLHPTRLIITIFDDGFDLNTCRSAIKS